MQHTAQAGDEALWRQKYYSSLEDLERRERQWSQLEALLRNTVSRMSLALETLQPELESRCEELRRKLRNGAEAQVLANLADALSAHLERLPGRVHAGKALLDLLDRVDMPRVTQRQTKKLRKALQGAGSDQDPAHLIAEFAALLVDAFKHTAEQAAEAQPRPASRPAPRPGLLQRWRASDRSKARAETERRAQHAERPDLGIELLRLVMADLRPAPAQAARLGHCRERLDRVRNERELKLLAAELGNLLGQGDARADVPTPDSAEVLLQLLERLDLPGGGQARMDALKERLERGPTVHEWPAVLNDIADTMERGRQQALTEKRELEEFLGQLTERLQSLDGALRLMDGNRVDSLESGQQLDRAVQEQVADLHTSVREAGDLDELKQSVQSRLDAIGTHMEAFLHAGQQRSAAAEQQIKELNQRLQVMENEGSQLRDRLRKERQAAQVDGLTGIPNRSAYEERAEQEAGRWKRFGSPLSLAVVDLDDFKAINDTYGHKAGDKALCTVAKLMAERMRETDFFARYGGEEFVLLLPGADTEQALKVLDELRLQVEQCGFHYRGQGVQVTFSGGVGEFRADDRAEDVFERADQALYRAKQQGKNRCQIGR